MASPVETLSLSDQLHQLNTARKTALGNPTIFKPIILSILPLTTPTNPVELRRWAADFIAEAIASPALNTQEKENVTMAAIDALKLLVEAPDQDPLALKSGIIAAASAYPVVMKWM